MRNVILNVAVSLDGYISGEKGEYDWCFTDQDYGMKEFFARIDATLIGRKTYDLMVKMGEQLYPALTNYVFSRTIQHSKAKNVHIVSEDVAAFVRKLKDTKGKGIWLFGGAELIHACLEDNLVDEAMLSIHPIILGGGKPVFGKRSARLNLTLAHSKKYSSGLIQLVYKVKKS